MTYDLLRRRHKRRRMAIQVQGGYNFNKEKFSFEVGCGQKFAKFSVGFHFEKFSLKKKSPSK